MLGKSNTTKAKKIIRSEIRSHDYNAKALINEVKYQIKNDRWVRTPYQAGKKMVEGGTFACYYSQTDDMLSKIYGKKNVSKWSDDKKWNVYSHLIARETESVYKSGRMNLQKKK